MGRRLTDRIHAAWCRLSTAVKLLIVLDVLALLAIGSMQVATGTVMAELIYASVDRDLVHHINAVESILARELASLEVEARTLAHLEGMNQAIESGEVEPLQRLLMSVFATHKLDGLYLVDASTGRTWVQIGQTGLGLADLLDDYTQQATPASGHLGRALAAQDHLWLVGFASVPGTAPRTGSVFVLVRKIDSPYLAELRKSLGPEIVLLDQGRILASSLPRAVLGDLLSGEPLEPGTADGDFRFQDVDLPGGRGRRVVGRIDLPGTQGLTIALFQSVEFAQQLIYRALGQVVLLGALLIGVTLGLIHFLVTRVFRPLERLTQAATRMAQGDLSGPVAVQGTVEVETLAAAFDEMRRQLQSLLAAQRSWNQELEQKVRERTQELREMCRQRNRLLVKVVSSQEEERRRIARELHDETSQVLANFIVTLGAIGRQTTDSRTHRQLAQLREIAVQALEDLKHIILDLRPRLLDDLGLTAAVRWHAERRLQEAGVHVVFQEEGHERPLPPHVQTGVFRIVQEALNNIARHAEATCARVRLVWKPEEVRITVADNGQGFEVERVLDGARGTAFGLTGMFERAELIGASLRLRSSPGKGTTVVLRVPLTPLDETYVEDQSADRG